MIRAFVVLCCAAALVAQIDGQPPGDRPPPELPAPRPPSPNTTPRRRAPPPPNDDGQGGGVLLPQGRGFDWRRAGYREGRVPIPTRPVTFNVKSFGARGDGATDDTAALQRAITAANRSPRGAVVLFPAGTYVLWKPLTVLTGGVVLRGAGESLTTIFIQQPLSEVYKGTWSVSGSSVQSQWSSGGAFITFSGYTQSTRRPRSLLARITGPVPFGASRIPVDSAARFSVGQRVRIFVNDGVSLRTHDLQNSSLTAEQLAVLPSGMTDSPPGDTSALRLQQVSGSLRRDPVFQAAAAGLGVLGQEGDEGLSPEQALAADKAAAADDAAASVGAAGDAPDDGWGEEDVVSVEGAQADGSDLDGDGASDGSRAAEGGQSTAGAADDPADSAGGGATADDSSSAADEQGSGAEDPVAAQQQQPQEARMAPAGSLPAWVYGENAVDSGSVGGVDVVDTDEVSLLAKVTAVGDGWIELDRWMPFPVKTGVGWRGEVHLDNPSMQDAGIEQLTIRFRHSTQTQHHADRGWNALQFTRASNCWVRNVVILNADNGIFFSWVDRSTITDVVVGMTAPRINPAHPTAFNGHHALCIATGQTNLVTRFQVNYRYIHDVTVAGTTHLNVWMEGRGVDLNIDCHRTAPFANLFTALDMGMGSRPFSSGGRSDRGAHSGRGNTFWGIHPSSNGPLGLPACGFGPLLNFVGRYVGNQCPNLGWFIRPVANAPTNLYRAQLARLGDGK